MVVALRSLVDDNALPGANQQIRREGRIPANFRKHLDIVLTATANSTDGQA
jgi:hypothetical protein